MVVQFLVKDIFGINIQKKHIKNMEYPFISNWQLLNKKVTLSGLPNQGERNDLKSYLIKDHLVRLDIHKL